MQPMVEESDSDESEKETMEEESEEGSLEFDE